MKPPKKLWARWYECCEGHLGREVHETKREAVDGADKDAGPVTPLKYLLAPQPHRRREMSDEKDATCPECKGVGIEFRGKGLDMQYKICSAYRGNNEPPGHPPMAVVKDKIRDVLVAVRPSGRFA
jgi:hypothetical protein